MTHQPTDASGRGGFDSAFARLNVTFAGPTGARSYLMNVTLISEDSGWKVVTMAVAP